MNPHMISMKPFVFPILAVLGGAVLSAQVPDIPLQSQREKEVLDRQADEFNEALVPVLADAAGSTVRVWSGRQRLAYGTAVGDGSKVLTKYSEAVRGRRGLVVEAADGSTRPARVAGVYQDEDIAVLELEGTPLKPVQWRLESPPLGAFLIAPQPSGQSAAFGVVSVLERNLRETDKAFLGVTADPRHDGEGLKVAEVLADSGAAEAGLRAGDVILRIDGRLISGVLELQNALKDVPPGAEIPMDVMRGKEELNLRARLGNRPNYGSYSNARLRAMERMGGRQSLVRTDFPNAIQSDMQLDPSQVGGPVVDLGGRVVGITLARADRTRSFIMPAAALDKLLKTPPLDPSLARINGEQEMPGQRGRRGQRGGPRQDGPPGIRPADPDQARRHLDDMRQLMNRLRDEMERLEKR